MPPKPVYASNKDLLREIHNSKKTYCWFEQPEYADFDLIVYSLDDITQEAIDLIIERKANPKGKIVPEMCTKEDLIFRVMTYSHIPLDPDRKRKARNTGDTSYTRTNFPSFKHYKWSESEFIEVGRSHWKGDLKTGVFSVDHGRMSNTLARMFMLIVERYSRRGNWRAYSYNDEMRSLALVQLSQIGLQFDEAKSDNPFAFYTTVIKNCLAGDTLILTREYGSIAISQVSEQDVTLLDGNGDWVKCHIYDHGEQETQLTYFQSGGNKIGIRSTSNHGWVTKNGIVHTAHFADHDTKVLDLRPTKTIIDDKSYRRGIAHGIVYGDGSAYGKEMFQIRLCGEKNELRYSFDNLDIEIDTTFNPLHNGDVVVTIREPWCNLKELPEKPGEDLNYLIGFLRGWFATDGCVSTVPTPTLCGDEAEYNWVKQWGPVVGWHMGGFVVLARETNYGVRKKKSVNMHLRKSSMDIGDFLRSKHAERWAIRPKNNRAKDIGFKYNWPLIEQMRADGIIWKEIAAKFGTNTSSLVSTYCTRNKTKKTLDEVVWSVLGSKQPTEKTIERVYCPVVETTQSFALSCGIQSSNCFTRIANVERRNQNIRDDLMIFHGAMPSYTRQIEHEMERKFPADPAPVKKKPGRKPTAVKKAEIEREAKDKENNHNH